MNSKLVSIVIAAYNAEKYIPDCLDSILNQTYQNIEIIVCDDASTDRTFDILKKYSINDDRIHILQNKRNMFAGFSRNRCIKLCKGEYIAIQDADDVSQQNRIEVLVTAIEKYKCDFVSSGHYLFDENGIYKENIPKIQAPECKDFLFDIPFCHAATLFTRECLAAVNGYRISDETRRGQDYDMFMRLYANGYKGVNINDLLYGYRVDRRTISRRRFKYRIDECKIRYKGFSAMGLMPKGFIFVLKPIPAYVMQVIKTCKKEVVDRRRNGKNHD